MNDKEKMYNLQKTVRFYAVCFWVYVTLDFFAWAVTL